MNNTKAQDKQSPISKDIVAAAAQSSVTLSKLLCISKQRTFSDSSKFINSSFSSSVVDMLEF
jgi:hypothetical protein